MPKKEWQEAVDHALELVERARNYVWNDGDELGDGLVHRLTEQADAVDNRANALQEAIEEGGVEEDIIGIGAEDAAELAAEVGELVGTLAEAGAIIAA